jgi:hypothetical protein
VQRFAARATKQDVEYLLEATKSGSAPDLDPVMISATMRGVTAVNSVRAIVASSSFERDLSVICRWRDAFS